MRTSITYLVFVFVSLFSQQLLAQDDETLKYKVEQLERKKETVAHVEREALKNEVEMINKRLDNGEISKEKSQELKTEAAKKRAKNIGNKVAILENTIELVKRKGAVDLNTDINSIEIGFGADDSEGDVLFGIKYNLGNQKKEIYDRRTYGDPIIAFGLNNAIIEGQSLNDSPYKIGGSRFFEIGWAWNTRIFKNSNALRLHYGASFQFNGLKPQGNQYFVVNDGQPELEEFAFDLKKSKLRMDNLVFPVHFEFGPSKLRQNDDTIRYFIDNQFRFGIGAYGGFNLGTRQKLKYEIDGDNVKDKLKRDYNTTNLVYGLSAYAGFDSILLYVKYDLNPIFQDATVEQHNISLGLRFDLN
ncbi:hypothetical protein SAMN05421636_108228 [Pricia antarctica]|uniref:Outer membrane protein beta-barrel domain-containing protein n=1 Tax=Pricia antarctica TaxID=641691 RepID=A0A1G7GPJ1_9FLAO|nr:hypothetical protein [Pricia antarctica]SDE89899.1 hypothetical protein SAMN05421636_108228 [Pricia antarctica]